MRSYDVRNALFYKFLIKMPWRRKSQRAKFHPRWETHSSKRKMVSHDTTNERWKIIWPYEKTSKFPRLSFSPKKDLPRTKKIRKKICWALRKSFLHCVFATEFKNCANYKNSIPEYIINDDCAYRPIRANVYVNLLKIFSYRPTITE